MLSDRKQRALLEVQRQLLAEDPGFARSFDEVGQRDSAFSLRCVCAMPRWVYTSGGERGARGSDAGGRGCRGRTGVRDAGRDDRGGWAAPGRARSGRDMSGAFAEGRRFPSGPIHTAPPHPEQGAS